MTINNCNGNGKVMKRKDGFPLSSSSPHPHAIVIPFPLQGHVNPMTKLANQLVSKGVFITLILTHDIQRRLNVASTTTPKQEEEEEKDDNDDYGGKGEGQRRKGLRIVLISDGLPVKMDRMRNYFELLVAMNGYGNDQFEKVLNGLGPVHCIIADSFLPNTKNVAKKQAIPWVAFWSQPLCVYTTYYHAFFHLPLPTSDEVDSRQQRTVDLLNSLPGFPTMAKSDLPSFLQTEDITELAYQSFLLQFEKMQTTSTILANSFEELEEESIQAIKNKASPNFTCIGPLLPSSLFKRSQNEEQKNMEISGCSFQVEEWACIEWLNQKAPKSVVYISFGSLVSFSKEQMEEILVGVFESGVPFLWVARDMRKDLHHMFAKYNNSKTNGHQIGDCHNAMFVNWAPQLAVLSHVVVGGFMTHVGWNSTLESISCGVPMLTMPCFSDQTTTAKFASDTWKVALPLRPRHGYCGLVITRDVIKEELQLLFSQNSCVQDRAHQLHEAAHKAVAIGGSSHSNFQSFINSLFHQAS